MERKQTESEEEKRNQFEREKEGRRKIKSYHKKERIPTKRNGAEGRERERVVLFRGLSLGVCK